MASLPPFKSLETLAFGDFFVPGCQKGAKKSTQGAGTIFDVEGQEREIY